MNVCAIRITGMKDGYDKTLMMFAYQGKRNNFFAYDINYVALQRINGCRFCLLFPCLPSSILLLHAREEIQREFAHTGRR